MTIESRIESIETAIKKFEDRGIFEGDKGCFITSDGRKVEIGKQEFYEIYEDIARNAWNDEPLQHELINDINKATDSIGLYFKCLTGEE